MKKRIGKRMYNTETSEFVADVGIGNLYRKRTCGREWFLAIGKDIEPMDDKQARALLGERTYIDKPVDEKRIMIGVYRETHAKIMNLAKEDDVKVADEVDKIVKVYLSMV